MDDFRLAAEELSWRCNPAQFEFSSTADLEELEGTIGQDRALTAIEFGLGIRDGGFNIFILGEIGTGRSSTIKKILQRRAENEPVPDDWCYLHDLKDGTRPTAIHLPAGTGVNLQQEVETLVGKLAEELPKVFESREYEGRKSLIAGEYQEKNQALFQSLEERASGEGFLLQRSVSGLVLVPTRKGEALSQQQYEDLPAAERKKLDAKGTRLQEELNEVLRQAREQDQQMQQATLAMEQELLKELIAQLYAPLEKTFADHPEVLEHFGRCKDDLLQRLEEFRPSQGPRISLPGFKMAQEAPSFERYLVNLFLDNNPLKGAPVVYEANPTYFNLFGRIEHLIQMGNASTNFTMIKPGALHRSKGGYLVLDCREVLLSPFSYEALKRAIRNREVKIEDMVEQYRLLATVSLKPEPIPLDCKIILIGTPMLYYLLYQLDPDFRKYFKVKADFDRMMKNTWENLQQLARFIATLGSEEKLLPFDPSGVARVAEHSARMMADKARLSARFLDLADLLREASFFAARQGLEMVAASHVALAIEAKTYRSNKLEEHLQEAIEEGTILVDTEGAVVGQINGLSVYQLGDYAFGKPARVTARSYLGKAGLVNIEREAKLSGPIHDKGVLILTGFLGDRFAQDKPLALAASICFEQSYGGIEGDSASSTELYALLSCLADLPIQQGIAVTGSVNQRGQLQPIGGVNEKIEGFFALCQARGLSGEQGVIIPLQNVKNLMLQEAVIAAVSAGTFHVWAVATIDEGIEILTRTPAGVRRANGSWSVGSVNARVDHRLRELAEAGRRFGETAGSRKKTKGKKD